MAAHRHPAGRSDQGVEQRSGAALKASRRPDARQLAHEQAQVQSANAHQEPLEDVGMAAQMDSAQPPGFVEIGVRPFEAFAPAAHQTQAAGASDPPAVGIHGGPGCGLAPPAAPPAVRLRYVVSARKPSFRAEICANSWHPGRDFGTDRRRRRRLTSCGIAKGSKSARMSCFQGQEDRAVSCRLGIQLGYQGRLVRRRVVVVCVPASAGSTRCDAGWPPAPTRQPYARNRPHHGCELGRVPDAPTH